MPQPIVIENPNPQDHLRTEWLLTNGLGGYAMGTVLGINTRRYHGLLVAATNPPVGRIVALHSMIEQLIIPREDGTEEVIDLSTQVFWQDGEKPMQHPSGYSHLVEFKLLPPNRAQWKWFINGFSVWRTVEMIDGLSGTIIRYAREGGPADVRLHVRPLISLRNFHAIEPWMPFGHEFSISGSTLAGRRGPAEIELEHETWDYVADRQVWVNFAYVEDRQRGQDARENVLSPGVLTCRLPPSRSAQVLGATLTAPDRGFVVPDDISEETVLATIDAPPLQLAGRQFVTTVPVPGEPQRRVTIIAGYPWFSDWGRDAMISLPGLLLCTRRFEEAKSLLLLFASHLRNGLIPNHFDDATGEAHYNTVDASLWFIYAVWQYWKAINPLAGGTGISGAGVPPVTADEGSTPSSAVRTTAGDQLQFGGAGVTPAMPEEGSMLSSGVRAGAGDELRIRRRRLPHWEMGGSTYFVTFDLRTGSLSASERRLVADAVRYWHGERLHLHIAVVMPDHVHMLFQPLERERGIWWSLAEILHSIKSFTAHRIQKQRGARGPLWQDESFDRIVRDEREFLEKWNYIETNPVRKGLAADSRQYPFLVRPTTAEAAVEAASAVTGVTPAPPTPAPPTPVLLDPPLLAACRAIIRAYREGTDFDIFMDPADCLIAAGNEQTQLTWMDAARDGVVFTPRHGKPVEVNALWFNALHCVAELTGDPNEARELRDLAARVGESFIRAFWWQEKQCLHDVLVPRRPRIAIRGRRAEVDSGSDGKLRPNQIFAVALPFSPLPRAQQRAVVDIVRAKLLTPFGLRTLDRDDPDYRGRFEGNLFERDRAYHNGTAWPWLLGPYCEAVLRSNDFSDESRAEVRALLQPLLDELTRTSGPGCLGQLAEVYDGDPPQRAGGCVAQAWSVAEVLRILSMTE